MAKKKKIDLKLIVAEALDYYHNYVKKTIKESTKRQNESLLSEFYRFVDTLPARDKTMKIFSQKGLNRYKEYLIDKMERSKTDGKKRNFGVGQLNRCGAIIALLINRVLVDKEDGIVKVSWKKVDDPRSEYQKGHIPLLDDEVAAIENCSGLTPVEEVYRDIFLLQVESGHRVSDLCKILTGKYWIEQGEKEKFIVFSTQKENIKGRVIVTSRVNILTEELKSQKLIDLNRFEEKTKGKGNNTYNEAIRRIAKKAKLDREIVKIDSTQIEIRRPLYETISSHDARCTFITKKVIEGWPYDRLCWLTGHASDDMIKRVYAQLTDTAKIKAIESFLSSGKNEKEANTPTDTSSKNPNEPEALVSTQITGTMPVHSVPDSTSFLESNEFQEYDRYIQGLNKCIDDAINESLARFPSEKDKINSLIREVQERFKSELKEADLGPKEEIIEFWHRKDSSIMEAGKEIQDCTKTDIDIYRIYYLIAYIDYLKDNRVGEDAIDMLERIFHELCEENPFAYFVYKCLLISDIVLPIYRFTTVLYKTCRYIIENRPVADKTYIEDDGMAFRYGPKWNIIFSELQLLPVPILETLTQNTQCQPDIKTAIFNNVRNGDYDGFARIIAPYENEVRILISHAYGQRYLRTLVQATDYMHETMFKDPDLSLEKIERAQDVIDNLNPYVLGEEQKPDFLNKETKDIDFKKLTLWLLDQMIEKVDGMKKYARSSEIKALNRLLRLVDMDQRPKLKEAYEEYKAKQNTSLNSKQTEEVGVLQNPGKEFENPKDKVKVANYITFNSDNLDVDKLVRLLTEKDKLNKCKQFITVLESTNNVNVATCLKHFLGTFSTTPLSFKLKWNGRTKASLKFLIRLITNSNEEASRSNVIDESEYDGISNEYVSQRTGSGELWTPVCNVFGGSTGYMMSVGLGDEGSKARKINLEQYNTIADIYFECKK